LGHCPIRVRTSDLSITGPTSLPTALTGPTNCGPGGLGLQQGFDRLLEKIVEQLAGWADWQWHWRIVIRADAADTHSAHFTFFFFFFYAYFFCWLIYGQSTELQSCTRFRSANKQFCLFQFLVYYPVIFNMLAY
jgi:hypothetical protein